MVEKHLMRWGSKAPDSAVSIEPEEFADMVFHIRRIEEMFGTGKKVPCEAELKLKPLVVKDETGMKRGVAA